MACLDMVSTSAEIYKGFQIPSESSWDPENDCESEGQCWESEEDWLSRSSTAEHLAWSRVRHCLVSSKLWHGAKWSWRRLCLGSTTNHCHWFNSSNAGGAKSLCNPLTMLNRLSQYNSLIHTFLLFQFCSLFYNLWNTKCAFRIKHKHEGLQYNILLQYKLFKKI